VHADPIAITYFVGGNTVCTTNLSASGAIQENDVITMTCSTTYSGNWAPVMRWFNSVTSSNFTDEVITLTTNETVTSQLTVTASAGLHGSKIVCVTSFTQPSPPLSTSATNIPSYTYTWTSPILNVQCKCGNGTDYFSVILMQKSRICRCLCCTDCILPRCYAQLGKFRRNVCLSVRLSDTIRYYAKTGMLRQYSLAFGSHNILTFKHWTEPQCSKISKLVIWPLVTLSADICHCRLVARQYWKKIRCIC